MKKQIRLILFLFMLVFFAGVSSECFRAEALVIIETSDQRTNIDTASALSYSPVSDDSNIGSANYRHDYLLDKFWLRYRGRIIVTAAFLALLSLFGFFTYKLRKRSYTALQSSEQMLRNIANNINGGVLSMDPQKNFRISYVNDGFLKLLGYSKEELTQIYERDYPTFIYPEDRPSLSELLKASNQTAGQQNGFSVQLRIKGGDGKYVPTLVKGSIVRNEQGKKELFCVVMDISRERAMLEELGFEQERHKILMEKSDEILFEINYAENSVMVSPKFKDKFGWTLPDRYWGDREPNLIKVYEEDRQAFDNALQEIEGGSIDGELITRICKGDGSPCWCKILYHVMNKNGEKVRLIGKLSDVDEAMKEKQTLRQKAQVDALTGLYNKDAFKTKCEEYINKYPDTDSAIIFFDLDNFKEINDRLGHTIGDTALKDISEKIKLVFSGRDILGRFGGDEFCVLVKNVREDELIKTLDRLIEALRLEYIGGSRRVTVSVSAGVVLCRDYGNDFDTLLDYADKALYLAKEKGKNGYVIYFDELILKGYTERTQ